MNIPLTSNNLEEKLKENFYPTSSNITKSSSATRDSKESKEFKENITPSIREILIEKEKENNVTELKKNDPSSLQKEIYISKKTRWVIFTILMILQIMMNVDHGTVPAALEEIRKDLKIDDDLLGIFASLVFLGNLIGNY